MRLNRRAFLKGTTVTAGMISMPFVHCEAAERSLRVSTFGGYFKSSFVNAIFPAFEQATGIRVEQVADQANIAGLMKISTGASPAQAPADLVTVSQEDVARGADAGLWRPFDTRRMQNLALLDARFVHERAAGADAIGGMGWCQTLIVNPNDVERPPASWKILWDPAHRGAWGLASGSRSTLFEITAKTWFGGNDILATEDGIRQVVAKIAELRPNVKLWWASEGTMQTAFEAGEVIGGMYFHDVACSCACSGAAKAVSEKNRSAHMRGSADGVSLSSDHYPTVFACVTLIAKAWGWEPGFPGRSGRRSNRWALPRYGR